MSPTATQSTRDLDTILADVRAEHDETVRGLKAALAKVTEERDAETTRADLAEAAGVEMANTIADGLRREERLHALLAEVEAERDKARRERNRARINERVSDEMTAAMRRDLDEARVAVSGLVDERIRHIAETAALKGEIGALQLRLAASRSRFPGSRRRDR